MNRVSLTQKNNLFKRIQSLLKIHAEYGVQSLTKNFHRFENQLALKELNTCFLNSNLDNFESNLREFLSNRWARIRGSNLCYTEQPLNELNVLCLELAKALAPPASTAEEIQALAPNTGPYCLLMPSLSNTIDTVGENIHHLGLHEFILSDNQDLIIPISDCFFHASESDSGELHHIIPNEAGELPLLSASEIKRLSNHSQESKHFYEALKKYNNERFFSEDIESKLLVLKAGLHKGGTHHPGSTGTEFDSGAEANEAILSFSTYWENLIPQKKDAIFEKMPELEDILGRLFRPNSTRYSDVSYCVALIGDKIDLLLQKQLHDTPFEKRQKAFKKQEQAFQTILKKGDLHLHPNNPIPNLFPLIAELNPRQQKEIFKGYDYDNALMYALVNHPDMLNDKQWLALKENAYLQPYSNLGLFSALNLKRLDLIQSLIEIGADLSCDKNGATLLHQAVKNNDTESVKFLLQKIIEKPSSEVEKKDLLGPLLIDAIHYGNLEILQCLLDADADINIKSTKGKNVLDYAVLFNNSAVIKLLLKKIATYPAPKQAECLARLPGGPYQDVFKMVIPHSPLETQQDRNLRAFIPPHIFPELIDCALMHFDKASFLENLFTEEADLEVKKLQLGRAAAETGAITLIKTLLDKEIISQESLFKSGHNGSSAFHWAAYRGHLPTVKYLLGLASPSNPSPLDSTGDCGFTALHFAILQEHSELIAFFIDQGASLNYRNEQGANAIDMAIEHASTHLNLLLLALVLRPLEEQKEALLAVPGGPYPNVFYFAAAHRPALLSALIEKSPLTTEEFSSIYMAYDPLLSDLQLALHLSLPAQVGDLNPLRALLSQGIAINKKDQNHRTALHWATYYGHLDCVIQLCQSGADINLSAEEGKTALHLAIMKGHSEVVDYLLACGADLNLKNNEGKNALELAIQHQPQLVKSLLIKIATLPIKAQQKYLDKEPKGEERFHHNVLFYTIKHYPQFFDDLLTSILNADDLEGKKALLNDTSTPFGVTAIYYAMLPEVKQTEQVKELIAFLCKHSNFNITRPNPRGGPKLLDYAAQHGDAAKLALCLALYKEEQKENLVYKQENTLEALLQLAAQSGRKDNVEFLLSQGANPSLRNASGQNVVDIAARDHKELLEPILMNMLTLPLSEQQACLAKQGFGSYRTVFSYAADLDTALFDNLINLLLANKESELNGKLMNECSFVAQDCLELAVKIGATKAVFSLIKFGQENALATLSSQNGLLFAARYGQEELFHQLLLEPNLDLSVRNKDGKNVLDLAMAHCPALVASILFELAKLPAAIQEECLKEIQRDKACFKNVLEFAAAHKPAQFGLILKAIIKSDTDLAKDLLDSSKQEILLPCTLAAKAGAIKDLKDLINPSPLQFYEQQQARPPLKPELEHRGDENPLNAAVYFAQIDTVKFLLSYYHQVKKDHIQQITTEALFIALAPRQEKDPGHLKEKEYLLKREKIAQLLLLEEIDLHAKNKEGKNILALAKAHFPLLVETILEKLIKLPLEEQEQYLSNFPGRPYPNILFYVAEHYKELFDSLTNSVLNTYSANDLAKLIAQRDSQQNTIFHLAMMPQKGYLKENTFTRLLEKGADICLLNSAEQKNLIKLAIDQAQHPECRKPHSLLSPLLSYFAKKNIDRPEDSLSLPSEKAKDEKSIDIQEETARTEESSHLSEDSLSLKDLPVQDNAQKQKDFFQSANKNLYPDPFLLATLNSPTLLCEILEKIYSNKQRPIPIAMQLITTQINVPLHEFAQHYKKMRKKVKNKKYKEAVDMAEQVLKTCINEIATLYQSPPGDFSAKLIPFIESCKRTIQEARPVLEKHRQLLKPMATILLILVAFPIVFPLKIFGIFSGLKPSTAHQKLDKLEKTLDALQAENSSTLLRAKA